MKKILSLLVVAFFISGLSQAVAYDITDDISLVAGDEVQYGSGHVQYGGVFNFKVIDAADPDAIGYEWQTFCAEWEQNISTSDQLFVDAISDQNTTADPTSTPTIGVLTDEVAWLYWQFSKGTLGDGTDYEYTSTNEGDQGNLQKLIWSELGQDYLNSTDAYNVTAYAGSAVEWLTMAETATANGWKNEDRVQILQFANQQDVLIAGTGTNPVPEPTTMALLGIGLIGLVAVGRKKAKRQ